MKLSLLLFFCLCASACATIYFEEKFDDTWEDRWVTSDWKKSEGTAGKWKLTAGEWYGDKDADRGIQTSQDARFYATTAKFDKKFSNKGKDLVIQFSVKHEQKLDCGGGYIKLLPSNVDQEHFSGDSPYLIMFGPDICGTTTKRVHAIFNYKGKNLLTKKTIDCETDQLTHVYTFIIHPDNTYEIRIDGAKKESGSLFDDWEFLAPKEIKDPAHSKPKDWVDKKKIDDPEDVKPDDWDDQPAEIPDPEAEKPDDWDDEADGEWEPPMIDNPDYKGEWKPKKIDNPDYKGPWVHPMIPNPDYVEDKNVYKYDDIGAVGFELWQVRAGSIFDNIIVTDDISEAEEFMATTTDETKSGEREMFNEAEAKKRAEEEKAKKEAEAARAAEEDDDDDDDDDEDEEEEEDDDSRDDL